MSNMNQTAFPVVDPSNEVSEPGLTKLEWAAVQIMAGMVSTPNEALDPPEKFARWAVGHARALFAELEKQG